MCHVPLKELCSADVGCSCLHTPIKSNSLIVLFKSSIALLILPLPFISVTKKGMIKSQMLW